MRSLGLILGLVLVGQVFAEKAAPVDLAALKHPVRPMLWKIEREGLDGPSYLFGTIHLPDERVTTLHPLAQKAFDGAKAVYTELDHSGRESTEEESAAMEALYRWKDKDERSLASVAGRDLVDRLDVELKFLKTGYEAEGLRTNKLWYLAVNLPMLPLKQNRKTPVLDIQLWQRAEKAGKKTMALEHPLERVRPLDLLPVEDQRKAFEASIDILREARESGKPVFHRMLDAYLRGDTEALASFNNTSSFMGQAIDPGVGEKFLKILVFDRNKQMAETIEAVLLRPDAGSCFFAVGAAHYVGAQNVGGLLRKRGYTVTLVAQK